MTNQSAPKHVDEYVAALPPDVQAIMNQIRAVIQEAAPGAQEDISYLMPVFRLDGHYLTHIGAYKKHIGLYPAPTGIAEFEEALVTYGSGKGTLKFPLDQPMPFDLIRNIVKFRVAENLDKPAAKAPKRKKSQS